MTKITNSYKCLFRKEEDEKSPSPITLDFLAHWGFFLYLVQTYLANGVRSKTKDKGLRAQPVVKPCGHAGAPLLCSSLNSRQASLIHVDWVELAGVCAWGIAQVMHYFSLTHKDISSETGGKLSCVISARCGCLSAVHCPSSKRAREPFPVGLQTSVGNVYNKLSQGDGRKWLDEQHILWHFLWLS